MLNVEETNNPITEQLVAFQFSCERVTDLASTDDKRMSRSDTPLGSVENDPSLRISPGRERKNIQNCTGNNHQARDETGAGEVNECGKQNVGKYDSSDDGERFVYCQSLALGAVEVLPLAKEKRQTDVQEQESAVMGSDREIMPGPQQFDNGFGMKAQQERNDSIR